MTLSLWNYFIIHIAAIGASSLFNHPIYTSCDYFHDTECIGGKVCNNTILCNSGTDRAACYATWNNDTGLQITQKGCWYGSETCTNKAKCIAKYYSKGKGRVSFFCCCQGDNCNRDIGYAPDLIERDVKIPISAGMGLLKGTDMPSENKPIKSIVCDDYDHRRCTSGGRCNGTVTCRVTMGMQPACYSSWRNDTVFHLVKKGCWPTPTDCHPHTRCISSSSKRNQNKTVHFCCCVKEMCNREFTYIPAVTTPQPEGLGEPGRSTVNHPNQLFNALCYSLVPIGGIFIIVVSLFWIWRRHTKYAHPVPTHDPDPNPYPHVFPSPGPVEILELRAYGRFGAVWKALLNKEYVAVKIFPQQDKNSWLTERDMYNIPNLKHDSVLRFIAIDHKQDNISTEFWLITEFHEHGSLYDYLKSHTINWAELCSLTETIACGLAYLHEDVPEGGGRQQKPAIAHRDFKSKNVLIKSDMTACIADFGLAMKFECTRGVGDMHAQVGTRRYMAPEVLDGAITFSREAFLRIDMYAFALVLWEVVSRCSVFADTVDYRLPFEEEIGLHPTLEEMQELVVHKKMRPTLKETWLSHKAFGSLCVTIEESWDHDSEGRLSAKCVEERISRISKHVNVSTSEQTNVSKYGDVKDVGLYIEQV